jgi:hypothetical protein
MDTCGTRLMVGLFAAVTVCLITSNTAHAALVHGLSASAIAKVSSVEKSVIIHRTPRRYSCWWQGWRRRCGWHG